MKIILSITTFLIIFQMHLLFGQDFAPIGAKWYYTEQFAFSGDISYLWIESVGDTIIKGKDCRILENNGGLMCAFHNNMDFVHYEDSIAYFYVPEIDTFQILYNLKAQKDSSWTIIFGMDLESKLDTIQVIVDSVSYMTINSKVLKKLHVTYKSLNVGWEDLDYGGEIIEKIGDNSYLFNLYSLSGIVCDGNYSGGLRCYEDSQLGFYSTGIAESCTCTYDWVGIKNNNSDLDINIHPNSTSNWFEIECKTNSRLMGSLIDLSGKSIKEFEIYGITKIDITNLEQGFYIVQIKNSDTILVTRKIIKN